MSEKLDVCKRLGMGSVPCEEMVALALETVGQMPIYGTRITIPENGNISWFIYCGEFSTDEGFYKPIHASHIEEILPQVSKYLDLPFQSKFIIDDKGYEDVWMEPGI